MRSSRVFVHRLVESQSVGQVVGLSAVQLHGDETPPFAAGIRRPVIKAIALGQGSHADAAQMWMDRFTLLLDAEDSEKRGGTGRPIDWTQASVLAAARRVVLAGGLTPDNVAEAIRIVRPYAVDVASGVESSPGKKDPEKVRQFIDRAREAAARL